jgi:hypothetical protein
MSDRRLLWIRVISGICILFGLEYLGVSIMGFITRSIVPAAKDISGFVWAALAISIIYMLCFLIGGIGLAFLRKWGRDILVTILWIDIITKIMGIIIPPIIFSIINQHKIHSSTPLPAAYQFVFYGFFLLEIMMLFYLSRKKTKEILVPKIPNSMSLEKIPAEE